MNNDHAMRRMCDALELMNRCPGHVAIAGMIAEARACLVDATEDPDLSADDSDNVA